MRTPSFSMLSSILFSSLVLYLAPLLYNRSIFSESNSSIFYTCPLLIRCLYSAHVSMFSIHPRRAPLSVRRCVFDAGRGAPAVVAVMAVPWASGLALCAKSVSVRVFFSSFSLFSAHVFSGIPQINELRALVGRSTSHHAVNDMLFTTNTPIRALNSH